MHKFGFAPSKFVDVILQHHNSYEKAQSQGSLGTTLSFDYDRSTPLSELKVRSRRIYSEEPLVNLILSCFTLLLLSFHL